MVEPKRLLGTKQEGAKAITVFLPLHDAVFRVVGECYVLGISEGEALLGPLSDCTRRQFASDPEWGVHSSFVNDLAKHKDSIDPRIPSPLNLQDFRKRLAESLNAKVRLRSEQLHEVFP
ncbi:hypothetical protein K504DRAFT_449387 [Pleomassaria siparia CBS 279.74]|uniref:Uncharacterized protein n=1 Tax=Pleomassaria siparia CBS 279.74 TaxID=1314801 RepID=A0A6G1JWA0_9PLEO|nr:hypothetical protein K504DRAFT_449387 [Pleomassaria siparia CBS 279.74]